MGNYVIAGVGNYVIVNPSNLGNYVIADNHPHTWESRRRQRIEQRTQMPHVVRSVVSTTARSRCC